MFAGVIVSFAWKEADCLRRCSQKYSLLLCWLILMSHYDAYMEDTDQWMDVTVRLRSRTSLVHRKLIIASAWILMLCLMEVCCMCYSSSRRSFAKKYPNLDSPLRKIRWFRRWNRWIDKQANRHRHTCVVRWCYTTIIPLQMQSTAWKAPHRAPLDPEAIRWAFGILKKQLYFHQLFKHYFYKRFKNLRRIFELIMLSWWVFQREQNVYKLFMIYLVSISVNELYKRKF